MLNISCQQQIIPSLGLNSGLEIGLENECANDIRPTAGNKFRIPKERSRGDTKKPILDDGDEIPNVETEFWKHK